MRLKDKVAIAVGAGQTPGDTIGNGRATAILLAREGARVVLVDRDREPAAETQSLIEAEGGRWFPFQADVTRDEDCRAFVREAAETYGRVDIPHNNVAMGTGDGEILSVSEETWVRILRVNLNCMFLLVRSALPVMREQRAGAIINISSIAAICSTSIWRTRHPRLA